jgi:hypothetical protein
MEKENRNPLIEKLITAHVTEYLFPGETYHTPDIDSTIRAEKMESLLRRKFTQLHHEGVDISKLTVKEVIGTSPDKIEITEDDYLSYM